MAMTKADVLKKKARREESKKRKQEEKPNSEPPQKRQKSKKSEDKEHKDKRKTKKAHLKAEQKKPIKQHEATGTSATKEKGSRKQVPKASKKETSEKENKKPDQKKSSETKPRTSKAESKPASSALVPLGLSEKLPEDSDHPTKGHRATGKKTFETSSTCTPSPRRSLFSCPASPAPSFESISAWKQEAMDRGMTLEEFMEELSQQSLNAQVEEHMQKLIADGEADGGGKGEDLGEGEAREEDEKGEVDEEEDEEGEEPEEGECDESSSAEESESSSSSDEQPDEEEEGDDDEEGSGGLDLDGESMDDEEVDAMVEASHAGAPNAANENPPAEPPQTANRELAVAVAKQHEQQSEFANANSKTHPADWGKFNRQCLDRKQFPQSLAAVYVRNKTDLFRVEIEIQRKAEKSVLNRAQRQGMKARDIHGKYPAEKAKQLISQLKEKGLWYWDKDFPQDEEDWGMGMGFHYHLLAQEIYYYVQSGHIVRNDDKVVDSTSATIRDRGNKELTDALTTGNGPLANGATPEMIAASQKALTEAVTSNEAVEVKPKKEKKDKAEKQEPKTFEELLDPNIAPNMSRYIDILYTRISFM
eukprot:Skav222236  [mRNA]  locus=scaffold3059:62962:65396:+ [translate_table: standard]